MIYLAQFNSDDIVYWVVGFLILIFVVFLIFISKFINLWIQATLTKANIGLFTLVAIASFQRSEL